MDIKAGDVVEWRGGDRTVGPIREIVIRNGDRRKVIAVVHGGLSLWLEGRDGRGAYGTVNNNDVVKV
jgi:hypothetical protein